MENSNTEDKTLGQGPNFSPTELYQYEESKREEQYSSPRIQEFHSDDQPQIVDETNLIQSSELDSLDQQHVEEGLNMDRELVREAQNERNLQVNNEIDRNLDTEFYQHSLQYLVQNLNNLRDTLQTILTNNELVQELGGNNQQQTQANFQRNALNNEGQLHDQLVDIRRILANNMNSNNIQNPIEEQIMNNNLPRNNLNSAQNSLNNWINTLETSLRQALTSIPKSFNLIFWIIFSISILLVLSGLSNLPHNIRFQNADYFVQWLAFHKNSRLFLLVGLI